MSIYKTGMHLNSLDAHDGIAKTKPAARETVFKAICAHPGRSRQGIADLLVWPINRVTGRVKELLESGAIVESGTQRVSGSRRRALLWENKKTTVKQGQLWE